MELVGLRVIRGKDWNSDDVDGGEGHVGTIVNVGGLQTVDVLWDNGKRNTCRIGHDGKYDLRIVDNGTVGVRHEGYTCIVCGEQNICGMRWKCTECKDCNLCTLCYFTDKHDLSHEFTRFVTPGDPGTKVTKRGVACKVQSLGIYPGAIVKRGQSWKSGDQDGGDGKTGEVLKVKDDEPLKRCVVEVKWSATGNIGIYRLGAGGNVDVQFVQESRGISYYRDHLPHCKKMAYNPHPGSGEASGSQSENFNEEDTIDAEDIKFGDTVRILSNKSTVKSLQEDLGCYNPDMDEFCGKVGLVVKKIDNRRVRVLFEERQFVYNSACCTKAPGETVYEAEETGDLGSEQMVITLLQSAGQFSNNTKVAMLLKELKDGNNEAAFSIIRRNPEVVNECIDSLTPLIPGCNEEQRAFVEELLEKGGNSALIDALKGDGNREIAKLLINHGVNINEIPKDGNTAAHQAAFVGFADVLNMMIEKGCNVNSKEPKHGFTPIHFAIHSGNTESVRSLCKAGNIDLTIVSNDGFSPIAYAAFRGRPKGIEAILNKSKDTVNMKKYNGITPLHIAAVNDHTECVEILLQQGRAEVDSSDSNNCTPLHVACIKGYDKTAGLLIENNADINCLTRLGDTPLHLALEGDKNVMRMHRVSRGQSLPGTENRLKIARMLVKKGASLTKRNHLGRAPLDVCENSQLKEEVIKLMRERSSRN